MADPVIQGSNPSMPAPSQDAANQGLGLASPAGLKDLHRTFLAIEEQLQRCVRGKAQVIRNCLIALAAGGHILLEDQPGVGKTTLAKALAASFGAQFSRVQFTVDLLPSDLLGMSIWSPKQDRFEFYPGPIFSNLLLADEINRAPPRTQSALLQAMAERKVSLDGHERPLNPGFCVIATQNPADHLGTYPLPESQRDRFALRLCIGYPDPAVESEIYAQGIVQPEDLRAQLSPEQLLSVQQASQAIFLHPSLARYVQSFTQRSREIERISVGLSVRGGLSWIRCAKARAWIEGRQEVLSDDLQSLAIPALAHRLWIRDCPQSAQQAHAEECVHELLAQVQLP